jgi:hypothetical protein
VSFIASGCFCFILKLTCKGRRHGSSGRMPASQAHSPEFKPVPKKTLDTRKWPVIAEYRESVVCFQHPTSAVCLEVKTSLANVWEWHILFLVLNSFSNLLYRKSRISIQYQCRMYILIPKSADLYCKCSTKHLFWVLFCFAETRSQTGLKLSILLP